MAINRIVNEFTPALLIHSENFKTEQRGTAPNTYCIQVPLHSTLQSIPTGYFRKDSDIDTPTQRVKSKPYFVATVRQAGAIRVRMTPNGPSNCGSMGSGQSTSAMTVLPAPTGLLLSPLNSPTSVALTTPTNLSSNALISAYLKIRDAKLDLAEFIGEFAETAGMMARAVSTAGSALTALAKRDYREVARLLLGAHRKGGFIRSSEYQRIMSKYPKSQRVRALADLRRLRNGTINVTNPADTYFLFNFGFLPLISVIQDAQMSTLGSTRVLTFKGRGSATQTRPVSGVSGYYISCKGEEIVKVQVTLKAAISLPQLAALSQLGISSPFDGVRALYAATPFSWLVDYFYRVGDWLSALSAPIGLTFMDGCISTKYSLNMNCGYIPPSDVPTTKYELLSGSVVTAYAFKRQPLYNWPFPGAIPSNVNLLRPDQILNMGMILLQRLR